MGKQYIKRYYKWVPIISWMIIIFMFSNEPAVVSDEKSRFIIYIFKNLGLNLDSALGELSNFVVRKTGHIIEYFVLYLLLLNAVLEYWKKRKAAVLALFLMIVYAVSDEFHQTFIPGRAGRVSDVFIDSTGAVITVGIIYLKSFKTRCSKEKKH